MVRDWWWRLWALPPESLTFYELTGDEQWGEYLDPDEGDR